MTKIVGLILVATVLAGCANQNGQKVSKLLETRYEKTGSSVERARNDRGGP